MNSIFKNIPKKILFSVVAASFIFSACAGGMSKEEALKIKQNEHLKGPENAPVVLVEYADFQCPGCALYSVIVDELVKNNPDSLQVAYRHLPLVEIHGNALLAAKAAEAAHMQGKFWEMNKLLFERQSEWSENGNAAQLFTNYANELGLDAKKFVADLKGHDTEIKINEDYQSALSLGLNGTPSFFINGNFVDLSTIQNFDDFQKLIDEEKKKVGSEANPETSGSEQ